MGTYSIVITGEGNLPTKYIEMARIATNKGINVGQSLRSMGAGECLVFPRGVNEITVRNACTRIKNTVGMVFIVNRRKDGSFLVTRTY